MSISIQLNLYQKPVLIVGGGKVALRKCRQYVKEGAKVTVVAKTLLKEFRKEPICIVNKEFHPSHLQHMFLVYAATDDIDLNEDITKICAKYHILCGSATQSRYRSFSSMQQYQKESIHFALSTNEVAVKLSKEMLEKGMNYLMDLYGKKLKLLEEIKSMVTNQAYIKIRGTISLFTEDKLEKLIQILHRKKVYVLVFHGVADENIIVHDTNRFIKQIESEENICISCVASKKVSIYCQEHLQDVFLFDEVLQLASYCKDIKFYFDIVLIREGRYYLKLANQCKLVGELMPFWFQKDMKEFYINKICMQYQGACCLFVLHDFDEEIHEIAKRYQGLALGLKDDLAKISSNHIHLIPVFINKGSHFIEDVLHNEKGIYAQYVKEHKITIEETSLIEQQWFIDVFKSRTHSI